MNIKTLSKLISPIKRRIQLLLTRGVVKLIKSDLMMQELQIKTLGTTLDNVEHFEPYGFTSHPQTDAEALLASLGGSRGHTVALCVADRRFRIKNMAQGEVAIYTDEGDFIHFKRNNIIDINSADTLNVTAPNVNIAASIKVTITSPDTECSGNLTVGGNVAAGGNVNDASSSMQDMRNTYNGHTHPYTDDGTPLDTSATGTKM